MYALWIFAAAEVIEDDEAIMRTPKSQVLVSVLRKQNKIQLKVKIYLVATDLMVHLDGITYYYIIAKRTNSYVDYETCTKNRWYYTDAFDC